MSTINKVEFSFSPLFDIMVLMFSKVKNLIPEKWRLVLLWVIAVLSLIWICFQYARIAHFPTGDDPAIHILFIQQNTFAGIWQNLSYPIPLTIFKYFQEISGLDYPKAFVSIISTFLCFSSIAVFLLTKKVTNNWLFSFVGAIIFATGGWVTDGLRMGLLAESFGWGMLALTLYFLISQNITLTLIFSGLLALSHPFSFVIFVFVAVLYLLITMFSKDKKERNFAIILASIYLIGVLLISVFDREIISKFVDFVNPERAGWGERKLWEIATTYSPRRVIVAFFALIGLISSIGQWSKPAIKVAYLLLFIGLFMSMNQIFGIRFLVFRFFPYLEMGLAIFAVLGIHYFVEKLKVNKYKNIFIIAITIFAIAPHYIENGRAVYSQVNDASMNASMTEGDQVAFGWIRENTKPTASIVATHKRIIWIKVLTDNKKTEDDITPFDLVATKNLYDSGNGFAYDYFYYSEVDQVPEQIRKNFKLIYSKMGVRIYKR